MVIVNQAFAQKFFPNETVLGKHITPGAANHGKPQLREIVGVVANVKEPPSGC